jgi:hypothetical protein
MSAIGGAVQNGKELNNKTRHDDNGSQCKAEKTKSVRFLVQSHYGKACCKNDQANYHELVVSFAKGKFAHVSKVRLVITSNIYGRHARC